MAKKLNVKNSVEMNIETEVIEKETPVIEMNNQIVQSVDDLFFADVEKVKAKSLLPDCTFCSYNSHFIKVKPAKGQEVIVNSVSENYLLLPNKEIFPRLEKEMARFGKFEIEREVKNYGSFFATYNFKNEENKVELFKNDILVPSLTIQNSYNSKNLYNLTFGLHRLICANGLSVPVLDTEQNFALSHCENNLNLIINRTLEVTSEFLNKSKDIIHEFEPLMEKKVEEKELQETIHYILSSTRSLLSYEKDIVERIKMENKTEGVEFNLYSIYNGINYFLQPNNNSKMTSSIDMRLKTDQKILDFIFDMVG